MRERERKRERERVCHYNWFVYGSNRNYSFDKQESFQKCMDILCIHVHVIFKIINKYVLNSARVLGIKVNFVVDNKGRLSIEWYHCQLLIFS